jgi:hypothetical protein
VAFADEVRDTMREHARLAASRSGENQDGAIYEFDRGLLRGVERRQNVH